jgi:hypothetical protein
MSSYGFNHTTSDSNTFVNCHANNNGNHGFAADNYNNYYLCTSFGNFGDGFDTDVGSLFFGCKAADNAYMQFRAATTGEAFWCEAYGIAGNFTGFHAMKYVFGCTIDGEQVANTTGIHQGITKFYVFNTILHDLTDGIDAASSLAYVGWNLLNSTTNYQKTTGVYEILGGDVTGDPEFVNETNHDYSLQASSPAVNTGITAP